MDEVNKWALAAVICSVIACLTEQFISDERFERTVKAVLGCFMILAVVFPIFSFTLDLREITAYNADSYTPETSSMDNMERELIDKRLNSVTAGILSEASVDYTDLNTHLIYDDNDNASEISCTVSITEKDKSRIPEIKSMIHEKLGVTPDIICISSNTAS